MQNEWLKSILGEFQGYINEVKQNAQAQGINADFLDLQDGVLNHRAVMGEGKGIKSSTKLEAIVYDKNVTDSQKTIFENTVNKYQTSRFFNQIYNLIEKSDATIKVYSLDPKVDRRATMVFIGTYLQAPPGLPPSFSKEDIDNFQMSGTIGVAFDEFAISNDRIEINRDLLGISKEDYLVIAEFYLLEEIVHSAQYVYYVSKYGPVKDFPLTLKPSISNNEFEAKSILGLVGASLGLYPPIPSDYDKIAFDYGRTLLTNGFDINNYIESLNRFADTAQMFGAYTKSINNFEPELLKLLLV